MVLSSWFMVHGSWFLVGGFGFDVRDAVAAKVLWKM
jgi:hypothetical protein